MWSGNETIKRRTGVQGPEHSNTTETANFFQGYKERKIPQDNFFGY